MISANRKMRYIAGPQNRRLHSTRFRKARAQIVPVGALAEINTIMARASFLRSPFKRRKQARRTRCPRMRPALSTRTSCASSQRGTANLRNVQSRVFGKLGCALLSSWSATLIFWKGSVNSRLLLARASPHRQQRLSVRDGGCPIAGASMASEGRSQSRRAAASAGS